jgi:hypothetical protein
MLDPIDLERGRSLNERSISNGSGSGYSQTSMRIRQNPSALVKLTRVFRSQAVFTCSLISSLFILMSLIAVMYVQTGGGPSKSGFGCDLAMSAPHASNRTVGNQLCEIHRPLLQINKDLLDKIISQPLSTSVRFLVVGDWGRDGFCCQRDVAHEMARAAATVRPDFIANSGDSFYEYGLESENEEQIKTSWEDVYLKHDPLRTLPWFSVLGNHDYRGSVPAVLRIPQRNPKFVMKDRFYDHVFTSEDRSFTVHFFFLDTNPMIAKYHIPQYESISDAMLNQPEGVRTQWSRVDEQLKWLEEGLNSSTSQVKIVMGHHPAYTSGSHYLEDDGFIRNRIGPILEKNNVLAYFSGKSFFCESV